MERVVFMNDYTLEPGLRSLYFQALKHEWNEKSKPNKGLLFDAKTIV